MKRTLHGLLATVAVFLLLAILHVLFEENRVRLGRIESFTDGLLPLREAVRDFTPERAAEHTGISAEDIRFLAREFSDAPAPQQGPQEMPGPGETVVGQQPRK